MEGKCEGLTIHHAGEPHCVQSGAYHGSEAHPCVGACVDHFCSMHEKHILSILSHFTCKMRWKTLLLHLTMLKAEILRKTAGVPLRWLHFLTSGVSRLVGLLVAFSSVLWKRAAQGFDGVKVLHPHMHNLLEFPTS